MLPDNLRPSYKQYKDDTNAIVTWLASTGRLCGYPANQLLDEAQSPKAPRLKGKARKSAQSAARPSENVPQYQIAMKHFVPLAKCIAECTKPSIDVPSSFASALDRAIIVRMRHQSWWCGQWTDDKDCLSGASHQFFIDVLKKVRETLEHRMPTKLQSVDKGSTEGSNTINAKQGHLINLFENLEIEDLPQSFLSTEPTPSKPMRATSAYYCLAPFNSLVEETIALICLFNDLNKMRKYLQTIWESYKSGAFGLVAVSITTDMAIKFARHLELDFVAAFPNHKGIQKHVDDLFRNLCRSAGQVHGNKELPDDVMDFAVYDGAEEMFIPTRIIMGYFSQVLTVNGFSVQASDSKGIYDPMAKRASKSPREKYAEDDFLLCGFHSEFSILNLDRQIMPVEDELIRGVLDGFAKGDNIPIWLTFAAQIFLDIHHTLRPSISRGFEDLRLTAQHIKTNLTDVLEYHKNLVSDRWPKPNDQYLHDILNDIKLWIETDVVTGIRECLLQRIAGKVIIGTFPGQSPPRQSIQEVLCHRTPPHSLLKQHPLYCGLLSYRLKMLTLDAGVRFANAWDSINSCAHLYNALRQEKLVANTWRDMDMAFCTHRIKDVFVGSFPKTADDYFKRYMIAVGWSAQTYASNKRNHDLRLSKAGRRKLDMLAPVSSAFQTHYLDRKNRTELCPDDIVKILQQHAVDSDLTVLKRASKMRKPRGSVDACKETPQVPKVDRSVKLRTSEKKSQNNTACGMQIVDVLDSLFHVLQQETLPLTFDHFRLHMQCWDLLREVQKATSEELCNPFGPQFSKKAGCMPLVVVGSILMAASKTPVNNTYSPNFTKRPTRRPLIEAGRMMNAFLKSGMGNAALRMTQHDLGSDVILPDFWDILAMKEKGTGELLFKLRREIHLDHTLYR